MMIPAVGAEIPIVQWLSRNSATTGVSVHGTRREYLKLTREGTKVGDCDLVEE